ncbi:transposase [Pseudoalteromonas sp. 68 DY56-GL68]|uniref:transposase n=1 Tax=Pseudoalteromonas sp. 68 DY56-GL68 TaxID=2974919 RepID=UPI00352A33F3
MSKAYPSAIKREVLALIIERGISYREAAILTGASYSTVRRWVREAEVRAVVKKDKYIVRQLESRLESAVKEREILKRAVIIFAKELGIRWSSN